MDHRIEQTCRVHTDMQETCHPQRRGRGRHAERNEIEENKYRVVSRARGTQTPSWWEQSCAVVSRAEGRGK